MHIEQLTFSIGKITSEANVSKADFFNKEDAYGLNKNIQTQSINTSIDMTNECCSRNKAQENNTSL